MIAPKKKTSPPQEIHALRKSFEDALEEIGMTLVVLIDDLDRCLPSTTDLDRAINLGCWFSVGPAMLASKNGKALAARMPRERVLTESDGPFAQINGNALNPWDVESAIDELSVLWSLSRDEVKQNILTNLRTLVTKGDVA